MGKNVTVGAISAIVASAGVAVVTFASIPHSTTGIISACRSNSDGALRVIDSESGATCEASETALNWASAADGNSSHSALLRLDPNPEDPTNYVMNEGRSRNIADVKTVYMPDGGGGRMLCIKATFDPEVMDITTASQAGVANGVPINLEMRSQGGQNGMALDMMCGNDYHAFSYMNPGSGDVISQSISFRN